MRQRTRVALHCRKPVVYSEKVRAGPLIVHPYLNLVAALLGLSDFVPAGLRIHRAVQLLDRLAQVDATGWKSLVVDHPRPPGLNGTSGLNNVEHFVEAALHEQPVDLILHRKERQTRAPQKLAEFDHYHRHRMPASAGLAVLQLSRPPGWIHLQQCEQRRFGLIGEAHGVEAFRNSITASLSQRLTLGFEAIQQRVASRS